MNGRIYDPTIARFISPDPIISGGGGLQGHNRYSYCLNNPLKFIDPSGYIQKPLGWNDPLPVWNNGLGGVKGWCGPGSNKHWSDNYRSQYENYFLMSQRDFMDRYSMNSDQYYGFMGQINPNLTSKIGTTDDKYVVTNYSSLHKNGGFYINPNGNYFYLQAIFDDNTKITSIIKLSSNEQVYLSFDFNNPSGQGNVYGVFDNFLESTSTFRDGATIATKMLDFSTDSRIPGTKPKYQPSGFNPVAEAKVAKGMKVANGVVGVAGRALGVLSIAEHGNEAYKAFQCGNNWQGIGFSALTALDVGLMFVKSTNPFILAGVVTYSILDVSAF